VLAHVGLQQLLQLGNEKFSNGCGTPLCVGGDSLVKSCLQGGHCSIIYVVGGADWPLLPKQNAAWLQQLLHHLHCGVHSTLCKGPCH